MLETAWPLPDGKHDAWQPLAAETPASFDPNGGAELKDYWFVEEFVAALDQARDHEASGAEATHALKIIMGNFEAPGYGRPVKLPQIERDLSLLRWRRETVRDTAPIRRVVAS